jgi:hypothetical protein
MVSMNAAKNLLFTKMYSQLIMPAVVLNPLVANPIE